MGTPRKRGTPKITRMATRMVPFVVNALILCWLLATTATHAAQNVRAPAQAEALIRQGQLDQGLALLSRFLAAEPQNFLAHNLMGIALTGKGQLPAANEELPG